MKSRKKVNIAMVSVLTLTAIVAVFVGVNIYGMFNRTTSSHLIKDSNRNERWEKDLKFVKNELPKKHKNLFFSKPEKEFEKEMNELIGKVKEYNDDEIKAELAKIITSVNDSHTSLDIQGSKSYPLSFFEFEDGIYVTNTSLEHKDLLGKRLVEINGYSIEELHKKLDPFVSKDNGAIMKIQFCSLMKLPEVLKISGITKGDEAVFTFAASPEINVTVKPLEITDLKKTKFLTDEPEYIDKFPISKQKPDSNYWFEYIEESNAVYVKYNLCSNMRDYSFSNFTDDVFKTLDNKKAKTLIIDLRDNGGGNSLVFNPFFKEIKKRDNINKKENLFVIVGRSTFSSAVLNSMELRNSTNATLIGEPTGGKPNHYGEVKTLHLSNVNMNLRYSSKYFKTSEKDEDSIYPDIDIKLKASSYFKGRDDILDYILLDRK